jgi:5-formyltetrahydrofolate cyclo-ligase
MFFSEKAALRREMRLHLENIADTLESKSRAIRERLMKMDTFQHALRSERLMSFVSMPLEVDTLPLFEDNSMIVPYCEACSGQADEIIPIRIHSLDELEPSGNMKILVPKLFVRQNVSLHVLPEQIDVVLVPGLAFDLFGNRLGRGKGYYDRFLRRLPPGVLTLGLAFDATICERIPYDENDCPVQKVVTESRVLPE